MVDRLLPDLGTSCMHTGTRTETTPSPPSLACQELVHHGARTPNVGGQAIALLDYLRRHVSRRSRPRLQRRLPGSVTHGQAEICRFDGGVAGRDFLPRVQTHGAAEAREEGLGVDLLCPVLGWNGDEGEVFMQRWAQDCTCGVLF